MEDMQLDFLMTFGEVLGTKKKYVYLYNPEFNMI